jgi:hypothetical protein
MVGFTLWRGRTPGISELTRLFATRADTTSYTVHETLTDETTICPGRGRSRRELDVDAWRA